MKWGVWVPPWVSCGTSRCARFDCNELRHEENGMVRRYCEVHAQEYERQANALPEDAKLLRPSCFKQRAGVLGCEED